MSGYATDTVYTWLHSLIRITEKLTAVLREGKLAPVEGLLEQRKSLLLQQKKWVRQWKDLPGSADNTGEAATSLRALVDQLVQADKELVTLVALKKNGVAEQLKQAQNQKLLLAYSL